MDIYIWKHVTKRFIVREAYHSKTSTFLHHPLTTMDKKYRIADRKSLSLTFTISAWYPFIEEFLKMDKGDVNDAEPVKRRAKLLETPRS